MVLETQVILVVVLLLLSGFFSGAEIALVSLTESRVRYMIDRRKRGAVFIKRLKDDPQRMLSTILIGNNLVNVAASAIMTSIAIDLFDNYAIGIATGVMTLLILIFGEITPKSIAAKNNELFSQIAAPPVWYLSIFLAPILNVLDKFLNRLIGLTGIGSQENVVTKEEIISMIKIAEERGSIKGVGKSLLKNVFKFDDINVGRIATPRKDVVSIDLKTNVRDAMKLVSRSGYSRIPVYEDDEDNIVGIITIKDLVNSTVRNGNIRVKKIMKRPYVVPETKKISDLLTEFQKRREHIAVVVDEYGSLIGIVTLEDVLEEIVGEILDETDKAEYNVRKLGKNSWIIKGKTHIDEVNEKVGMKISRRDFDTMNGFILYYTGKIPKEGDKIIYKGFRIKIKEMEGNRISKVIVEKIDKPILPIGRR